MSEEEKNIKRSFAEQEIVYIIRNLEKETGFKIKEIYRMNTFEDMQKDWVRITIK